ncbi:hypothetical protein niasHT_032519 [Heterodera trifolii]|uniref:Uncharacterized protein n=1 Tax=Heterodera trifolii TaxID=157864 RepID=A0ABD2IAT8_9BILA
MPMKVSAPPPSKTLPTAVPLATKKVVCLAVLVVKMVMMVIIIMALLVATVPVKGINAMQPCTVPQLLATVLSELVVAVPAVVAVAALVDGNFFTTNCDNGNAFAAAGNANDDCRHNANDGKNIAPNGIDYWIACVPACTPLSQKTCATTIVSSEDDHGEPVVCRCKWTAWKQCVPLEEDE